MRERLYLCALPFAFLLSSVSVAVEPGDSGGPATAAEIEAAFDRLAALKQGLDVDDTFVNSDSRSLPSESTPRTTEHQLDGVDFMELVQEELGLNDQHRRQLARDGMLLRRNAGDFSFPASYYSIYVRDMPLLVTTDSILHAVHRSFDEILSESESQFLKPALGNVLADAHEELGNIAGEYAGTTRPGTGTNVAEINDPLMTALHDVDLYLTVARNLLAGRPTSRRAILKPHVAAEVDAKELISSIMSAEQIAELNLFGSDRRIDFSQFKPRGRYTSYANQNYFRTMSWLGRSDCGWNIAQSEQSGDRELHNAALLCHLVSRSGRTESLMLIERFLTELIGTPNGLAPAQLIKAMNEAKIDRLEDCVDKTKIQQLRARLVPLTEQKRTTRSEIVAAGSEAPIRFQLFSQRFAIDAFILEQVVFDAIEVDEKRPLRMLPKGLDVMASLGSDLAVELLRPELEKWEYWRNLSATRELVRSIDSSFWKQSFYNGWLHSISHLNRRFAEDEHVPSALQTENWKRKQLQSQLGSWAELRRDTVLYVAQTYSPPGCEFPAAYVEPYPELYASLRQLMLRTREHQVNFREAEPPSNDRASRALSRQIDFLQTAADHLGTLERIASKELQRESINEEEARFLERTISRQGNTLFGSGALNSLEFDGWYTELIYGFKGHDHWTGKRQERFHPVIADVHTSPSDGSVLQVATGRTDLCVLIVDEPEKCGCVYVGPAYSYYEFEHSMRDRLTGQQWREELDNPLVDNRRPEWIDPLLTSGQAPEKPLPTTSIRRSDSVWYVTHPGRRWGMTVAKIPIDDEGLGRVAMIAADTRWLDASDSTVTDAGLANLKALNQLKAINLSVTAVTDAGIANLADATHLRVLSVGNCDVGGKSMKTIKQWKYLGHLDLQNTGVNDDDLPNLYRMAYLRHVNLTGANVTEKGVETLKAKLPRAEVVWVED